MSRNTPTNFEITRTRWSELRSALLANEAVCRRCGVRLAVGDAVLVILETDAVWVCSKQSDCRKRSETL